MLPQLMLHISEQFQLAFHPVIREGVHLLLPLYRNVTWLVCSSGGAHHEFGPQSFRQRHVATLYNVLLVELLVNVIHSMAEKATGMYTGGGMYIGTLLSLDICHKQGLHTRFVNVNERASRANRNRFLSPSPSPSPSTPPPPPPPSPSPSPSL